MLMQNIGVTSKEHYGMLWYFLEWSIGSELCSSRWINVVKTTVKTVRVYAYLLSLIFTFFDVKFLKLSTQWVNMCWVVFILIYLSVK